MFELEDYSTSGFHEGFLSKYPDSGGSSTLDFYVTDSMQDILDVDIRAEVAHVVGSSSEMSSSLDHALEAISAINNSSNAFSSSGASSSSSSTHIMNSALHASPTAKWMGSASSWSSDYFADLGACVDPISVMPFISSSLLYNSSKTNLNVAAASPPPPSPCADRDPNKSHLTFSPAQMKISAGSMRREQVHAHIPKQIVTISSTSAGGSTTAPATMATNSALQRRNSAVDAIKKDLVSELRKANSPDEIKRNGLLSGGTATNTIKLAPGIGGLTFANSATYNKLKQQTSAKSPNGAPVTANGTIVLKRDRDSSPLHHMATLNGNGNGAGTKRSMVQPLNSYTPKSIASAAHSTHLQQNGGTPIGSPVSTTSTSSASSSSSSTSSSSNVNNAYNGNNQFNGLTPLGNSSNLVNIANNANGGVAVKPLQQKIKAAPVEPAFPKPAYSYSCLIAMALKNSRSGSLPVSEIYSFMCEHFPYFKNAPSGWKNSVRHNLSLNKCFEKIEKPVTNGNQRKGCLWAMNPERILKMDEEIQKWSRKDPMAIRNAMVFPDNLESLERGEMKHGSADSDVELDSQSEIEETSDLEEQEFEETLVDNMFVEEEEEEDDDEEDELNNQQYQQQQQQQQQQHNRSNNSQHHSQRRQHHQLIEDDALTDCQQSMVINGAATRQMSIDHDHHLLTTQKHRDFDIEVSLERHMIEKSTLLYEKVDEMYDAIDVEDDKEAVRMAIGQTADIIEINPADINANVCNDDGYQSPKRARLNLNYSIASTDELMEHHQQQQQQQQSQQNIKKVIVQPVQTLQQLQSHHQLQQQQQQQQHQQHQLQQQQIVLQSLSSAQQQQFQQQVNHRRKMQLVSRIV